MDTNKKLDELITLYYLEPGLKDIYVEGENDKDLIEWVLSAHNIKDIRVYSIKGIEINNDILERHKLNRGSNRSKVLALSTELAQSLPVTCKIVCIADRDQEDYLPSGLCNCFLEFTDYNSTELYLLRSSIIRKFISLVLGGFPISEDRLVTQALPILEDLYVLRLANQILGWNMEWIKNFTKYVKITEEFSFDRESSQAAYLQKNGKWNEKLVFERKVQELRSMLKGDPRFRLRGHDLMDLLYYVVKKRKSSRKFGDAKTFRGAFMGCLELSELSGERLFQRILAL
jgi:hypothetical protein